MARTVFFSFDWDDIMAVNVVRNANVVRAEDQRLPFRDKSLYEAAKNNPTSIRRAIDDAIDGTSITIVLVGQHTWRSDWVRYETARSAANGNGFVTIDIGNVGPSPGPDGGVNPLLCVKLQPSPGASLLAPSRKLDVLTWNGTGYSTFGMLPSIDNVYPSGTIPATGDTLDNVFKAAIAWASFQQIYFPSTLERAARDAGRSPTTGRRFI